MMDHLDSLVDEISRSHLFSIFSFEELKRMIGFATVETYSEGDRIFSQGDVPDKFYLILSGSVVISQEVPNRSEASLAVLGAGETLGEMSFLDRFPRSASVTASGVSRLLAFDFASFDRLFEDDREIAIKWFWLFGRALAQRLREANERIKELVESQASPLGPGSTAA